MVLEGALLAGANGWAGEFGHTTIEPGGALCRCGRRGCLEAYVSYHALRERAGLSDDILIDDLVDALALTRDRAEVIGMIGRSLGIAIANALNVLDMTTVVLSGYLAPIADELAPVIRETVERHALGRWRPGRCSSSGPTDSRTLPCGGRRAPRCSRCSTLRVRGSTGCRRLPR